MIDSYEIHQQLDNLHETLDGLEHSINPDKLDEEIGELEKKTEDVNFWSDQEEAQKILKELNYVRDKREKLELLSEEVDEIEIMLELIEEGADDIDIETALKDTEKALNRFRLETLLQGEYDKNNAIIAIHPGSGGTESNDWAEMLLRMYTRWAEQEGFKVKTLDLQPGGVAGVKSATLLIEGTNAYGFLKSEKGVHRLVRISPFDSSGRRHTSFASLDVTPEINDEINIEINPDDLRVDTYRASGAGGQHVNKTSSAIRITHLPTGIVVQCQNERSQHQNRDTAMGMLKSKLAILMEEENKEKLADLKGDYGQITWGNQIRSYVFQPYTLVKDHRTQVENGNIASVMDGNINEFINGYLLNSVAQ